MNRFEKHDGVDDDFSAIHPILPDVDVIDLLRRFGIDGIEWSALQIKDNDLPESEEI